MCANYLDSEKANIVQKTSTDNISNFCLSGLFFDYVLSVRFVSVLTITKSEVRKKRKRERERERKKKRNKREKWQLFATLVRTRIEYPREFYCYRLRPVIPGRWKGSCKRVQDIIRKEAK